MSRPVRIGMVTAATLLVKPGERVRLAEVRDRILDTLSAQRADQQLDEWLKHAKATTRIDYKKEAFE